MNDRSEDFFFRFSLLTFLAMVIIAFAIALLLAERIRSNAVDDLIGEAMSYTSGRILLFLKPDDLESPMTGEKYERFDAFVQEAIVSERTARIKLWARSGTIIYSDDLAAVGTKHPENPNLQRALQGEVAVELDIPKDLEHERERQMGTLMEIYAPLVFPGDTEPGGVLEIYQYYWPTQQRIDHLQQWTFAVLGAGFVILFGIIVGSVWRPMNQQQARLARSNLELKASNTKLAAAQDKLSTILNTAGEGIIGVDLEAKVTFVNNAAARILGWSADQKEKLVGQDHDVILCSSRKDGGADAPENCPVCEILRGNGVQETDDRMFRRRDNSSIQVDCTTSPMREQAELSGAVIVFDDITERKRAEAALIESQRALSTLMSNLPGMAFRCRNDQNWPMEFVSEGCFELLGYEPSDLVDGTTPKYGELIHPDDKEKVWNEVQSALRMGMPFQQVYRILAAGGRVRWVSTLGRGVYSPDDEVVAIEGFIHDITIQKQLEEQLKHDALHDPLTGLPNRTLFLDRLGRSVELTKRREEYQAAVLFVDLDHFKVVNDSLGHARGDRLLIAVADRLERCVRQMDTVARLGGDEFAILLEDIDNLTEATLVADRIQWEIGLPFRLDSQEVFTSASMGLVLGGRDYHRPDDILRDADIAMYRAKAAGRARCTVFDTEMHSQAVRRLQVEIELRQALERRELELRYQPIVSLQSGRIAGFEALLRWMHPSRGLLAPCEFLPVAEETGLILPIGSWVLQEACQQLRDWQEAFPVDSPLSVSVNLSPKQVRQPELVRDVASALRLSGLAPNSLNLEITEQVVSDDSASPANVLGQLVALGVKLHIDDFGTGYSSLSVLHRFPVSALKVDRSFLSSKLAAEGGGEILRAIMMLADGLTVDVIAEGVETEEEKDRLQALGCEFAQGYLFSQPLEAEAVPGFLTANLELLDQTLLSKAPAG